MSQTAEGSTNEGLHRSVRASGWTMNSSWRTGVLLSPKPQTPVDGQFVDYRDLAERHLGTIYEGLLEYHFEPNFRFWIANFGFDGRSSQRSSG